MHAHPGPGAKLQIAEVFRRFAGAYREQHVLSGEQRRVLRDLESCRTATLGGHLYRCRDCGSEVPLYNSCLNRHCPTCQGPAQYHWIEQRQRRLLNTAYFHVVFTLPAPLRAVVLAHRSVLLGLLFRAASQTLLTFAADPKWLGAQPGVTLVLHTWTRQLLFHPHLHAIVTGGGLSADGARWVPLPNDQFLFHVEAVSAVFRGKFLAGFIELWTAGKIDLSERESRKLVGQAKKHPWVVYAKRPFGGPTQIVNYLGRYTHRVAISSARLLSVTDQRVVFRTRGDRTCSLTPNEFLRRFLLHVLPHQFFKIRHYGLLAPGNVHTRLARARDLLGPIPEQIGTASPPPALADHTLTDAVRTSTGQNRNDRADGAASDPAAPKCPHCGGRLAALGVRSFHRPPRGPPAS
jgi:hypothetical protein